MRIPFIKAHGARNDFLLTEQSALPISEGSRSALAVAICDRNTGIGADGWIVTSAGQAGGGDTADAWIELWNSDGSRSEISGNGTRCAAAWLMARGGAGATVRIGTGAGVKILELKQRSGNLFQFQMNMGTARIEGTDEALVPGHKCMILNVGNPQCVVFVENFDLPWRQLGAMLERHPRFPNRTNVSFVKPVDDHTLDVRFFERGAGETMSSGTGSTGAVAAALAAGMVTSPVRVLTPAGPLDLETGPQGNELLLTGPAEIVASGEFYWEAMN